MTFICLLVNVLAASIRRRCAILGALCVAAPLVAAHAGFTITPYDLGTTGGNPAQEQYKVEIKSGGTSSNFTIHWHVDGGTNGLPAGQYLDASALVDILTFTTSELKLQFHISNNSTVPGAHVSGFGFEVSPSVLTHEGSGSFQNYNNFTLDLSGGSFGSSGNLVADLEYLATRWQGNSSQSFELAGVPSVPGAQPVPEPSTLPILALALAAMAIVCRYRRGLNLKRL